MKLVNRNHHKIESLRRMGIVCFKCGEWLCSQEEAPGHIAHCEDCHLEYRKKRKKLTNRSRVLYIN